MIKTVNSESINTLVNNINQSKKNAFGSNSDVEIVETEEVDCDESVEASTPKIESNEYTEEITAEDLELLVGSMSEEEYLTFIKGVEEYYKNQATYLEKIINGEDGKEGLKAKLDAVNTVVRNINISAKANSKYGVEEDPSTLATTVYKHQLESVGVSSYEELIALQNELQSDYNTIVQAIKSAKNMSESAYYDYIYYLEEYSNYKGHEITDEDLSTIDNYRLIKSENKIKEDTVNAVYSYDYSKYHKDHPDITPIEFIEMIHKKHPNVEFDCIGIENEEDLIALVKIKEQFPQMATTYSFLYSKDPSKAKEYLESCKYEINNFKGQIEAKEFLDGLYELDSEADIWKAIYDQFDVHFEGVGDGLTSFLEGLLHTGEAGYASIQELAKALGLYDGEIYENRTLSVEEYKRMYILQALLSKEDKEKAGLINEDGSNAGNTIIDFSKEYCGELLSNNYEISQGIGNILPSILISTINPAAGLSAMGVSSGGNAYHGAMVQGYDFIPSLLYGIITGSSEAVSQWILGGLPGLSETSVVGLKSWLNSMRKEANQEMFQGVLDAIIRSELLGEKLPETQEEWEEFAKDILKQGAYGAITAGYLQSPSMFRGIISTRKFNNFTSQFNVNDAEINDVIERVRNSDSSLASLSDEEIIARYSNSLQTLLTPVIIDKIIAKYNCTEDVAKVIFEQKLNEEQARHLIEQLNQEQEANTTESNINKVLALYDRIGRELGVIIKVNLDTTIPNSDITVDPIVVIDGVEYRISGHIKEDGSVIGGTKHISSEIQNTLVDYVIDPQKVDAILREHGSSETYESIRNSLIEQYGDNNIDNILKETIEAKIGEITSETDRDTIIGQILDSELSFTRLKRNLQAAGMSTENLGQYSIEELYRLNAEAQLRLNVEAIKKAVNKEFVIYKDGELVPYTADNISDITGVKMYVNASSDPDVPFVLEVIAYDSKPNQDGDIQIIHLCPPKSMDEVVSLEESAFNQVKRNMTQKVNADYDNNIFTGILDQMVKEGMPDSISEYKNLSPEQKQENIDRIINDFRDTIVSDISEGGYDEIGDPALREIAIKKVDELVQSEEFRKLIQRKILANYLKGNKEAYIQAAKSEMLKLIKKLEYS